MERKILYGNSTADCMSNARTPGKLLLFGEYTVLLGSTALALPLPHLFGEWATGSAPPSQDLLPFAEHLHLLNQEGRLLAPLDTQRFRQEVKSGLYFSSNIPVGYGAGSSGAVCAAVYERFARPAISKDNTAALPTLQQQLAQLESYFHGESSGADPLICYLQHPLLIEQNAIRPVSVAARSKDSGLFFLVDTGISRRTAPLVQQFKAKCEADHFREQALHQLAAPTTAATHAYLEQTTAQLERALLQIATAQLNLLRDFIPEPFRPVWAEGLQKKQFYLKLCGAGGGGFLIGYSPDRQLPASIEASQLHPLPEV
jgi:mevalonate kinase